MQSKEHFRLALIHFVFVMIVCMLVAALIHALTATFLPSGAHSFLDSFVLLQLGNLAWRSAVYEAEKQL